MKEISYPYSYLFEQDFLPREIFNQIDSAYPYEYIKEYCADPSVSEHESSLDGNFSAAVISDTLLEYVSNLFLPKLKTKLLGSNLDHDHHYVNYHYDLEGSSLGVHNDYKNFRWLLTCQIYFDHSSDGVRLLDAQGNTVEQLECNPNFLYVIPASPFTWHDVPPLSKDKRSILFRVGKRRHRTVANPHPDKAAWVIINDDHDDTHYAKLGPRMGNLTEAWLWHQECYNIYHTNWREDPARIIEKARKNHNIVNVIQSGDFIHMGEVKVTKENYNEVADVVFGKSTSIPELVEAENVLRSYHETRSYMNYKNI